MLKDVNNLTSLSAVINSWFPPNTLFIILLYLLYTFSITVMNSITSIDCYKIIIIMIGMIMLTLEDITALIQAKPNTQ